MQLLGLFILRILTKEEKKKKGNRNKRKHTTPGLMSAFC